MTRSLIEGGVGGQYSFSEDILGRVNRIRLDGTGSVIRPDAQFNGATFGGSADWHYIFNPSTFRAFISGIDNKIKSYAISDDFSNPAIGTLIGTDPLT